MSTENPVLLTPQIVYIRFGDLPESGRSKNHHSGEYEQGVSVYEALIRGERIQVLMPETSYAAVDMAWCSGRPAYIVEGDLIGTGSDREPVLQNCRIVRQVAIHGAELTAPPYQRPEGRPHRVTRHTADSTGAIVECSCGFTCQGTDGNEVQWVLDQHFKRNKEGA